MAKKLSKFNENVLDLADKFEKARIRYNRNPNSDAAERAVYEAGSAVGRAVVDSDPDIYDIAGGKFTNDQLAFRALRPAGEYPNDILSYYQSYIQSPGMDRVLSNQSEWWNARHPYRRRLQSPQTAELGETLLRQVNVPIKMYELNGDLREDIGEYKDGKAYIYRPLFDNNDPLFYDSGNRDVYIDVATHEVGHHFNDPFDKNLTRGQREALDINTGYQKNGHDEYYKERMSDTWAMKYLLYKTGIYDSRGTDNVTPEQIGKLREMYPNLRLFQQMPSDESLATMLNLVADAGAEQYDVLEANLAKSGGKIHIKPENRGKFTALKKRTGHSASWFKAHGTPAQKKMAVFALNARKWKHGDGGLLDRMHSVYGDDLEAMRKAIQLAKSK